MAPVITVSQTHSAHTLPRLLAINKNFAGLNEQIDQATHIIGLPEDWDIRWEEKTRSESTKRLVRARAEWVLRWILDKLKDDVDVGFQARANPRIWKLLDWMIDVLPTSRSATQLRDAAFLSILEKTLQENFEQTNTIQPTAASHNQHSLDVSESSETVHEDPKPSRKRKRPSSGASTPLKRVALELGGTERLFGTVTNVVKSIIHKTTSFGIGEEILHTEHMRMVLRTESAQAARILKLWLTTVNKVLSASSQSALESASAYISLSPVLEIWELRTIPGDDDSGASTEQFSTECLIPSLLLYSRLQDYAKPVGTGLALPSLAQDIVQSLEKLLARHLFSPARAAFSANGPHHTSSKADYFANNLEPLRAKILQAAQIQDTSEPIPDFFLPLFHSIPQLLDLAIRISPSRTPKGRVTERPWIQNVFVALVQCAGCPLEPPEFPVPKASINVLEELLKVLARHDVRIDSAILADLFWFHSGVKFTFGHRRIVHWSLVGALVDLEPDAFLTSSISHASTSEGRPHDLTQFLFDQISTAKLESIGSLDEDGMEIDDMPQNASLGGTRNDGSNTGKDAIIEAIIIPIMSAYARNRDLIGFIRRWDSQLCANAPVIRDTLEDINTSVWEDMRLVLELAKLFEKSLTQTQIVSLFEEHIGRVRPPKSLMETQSRDITSKEVEPMQKAYSSAVLLRAMLSSTDSDETVASLGQQLRSTLDSYTVLVGDECYRSRTDLASCWVTLGRAVILLWPLYLQSSMTIQNELLDPLIKQASKDISSVRKEKGHSYVNSNTRAAALLFLLTTCDHLKTVPGWEETLRESVHKVLKAFSSGRLESAQRAMILEIFCTEFPPLLEYLEAETRKESLFRLLTKIAELDQDAARPIAGLLSQFMFSSASHTLRDAYSEALLEAVDQVGEHDSLKVVADIASLQIRPSALSRERREAVLNKMTDLLVSNSPGVEIHLSVMTLLQQVPNATARIASEGSLLFDLAEHLRKHSDDADTILDLFQELVRRTLSHILPNKDQAQNKRFLEEFRKKTASALKKANRCYPTRLAILRAAFLTQKEDEIIKRDEYLTMLYTRLDELPTKKGLSVSENTVLDALLEIPTEFTRDDTYRQMVGASLQTFSKNMIIELQSFLDTPEHFASEGLPLHKWIPVHALLAKFKLYPNAKWFIEVSLGLLGKLRLDGYHKEQQDVILKSIGTAVSQLSVGDKLDLVLLLQSAIKDDPMPSYQILHVLIATLEDKTEDDAEQRKQQLSLLPTICRFLGESPSVYAFGALMGSIDTIIRDKQSYTSQHNIECVIAVLVKLSSRSSPALTTSFSPAIYTRLIETSRLLLLLHRGRFGGRFHLLLPLLQNLLFCLFIPNAGYGTTLPSWLRSTSANEEVKLTPTNAGQYTRLLSTLCSPTQSSVSKTQHRSNNNAKQTLNDPVKAAREYASHYLYPLLASYCRFQLYGRLDTGVREKLAPGIWEAVGVAGMDRDSLEAMFAGLDKAGRDIWRGVWEEWQKQSGRTPTSRDREA